MEQGSELVHVSTDARHRMLAELVRSKAVSYLPPVAAAVAAAVVETKVVIMRIMIKRFQGEKLSLAISSLRREFISTHTHTCM